MLLVDLNGFQGWRNGNVKLKNGSFVIPNYSRASILAFVRSRSLVFYHMELMINAGSRGRTQELLRNTYGRRPIRSFTSGEGLACGWHVVSRSQDRLTSLLICFHSAAGAETTSGVLAWWMLAMTAYPETQRRAQAELDAVVGRSRIPSFADFEHLPYIRAMVKEALRWHSVTPFAMPHLAVEDDWYEGYFIPAGTMCIPNVWHINRDPEIYGPDAAHFNPARHLDAEGRVAQGPADTKEESHCSFGFGRRLCVGRNVANNSLFIDIAMMLWAANIEPATDASGKPAPLDLEGCIDDGLVMSITPITDNYVSDFSDTSRPVPFECKITPRFPEALSILEQEQEILGK